VEFSISFIILIIVVSFIAQFLNTALGEGFGTIVIPSFVLLGFDPIEIVPSLLFVQVFTGVISAIFHHRYGNVDFSVDGKSFKIAMVLTFFSVIGGGSAAILAVNISQFFVKIYVGLIALLMGVLVLVFKERNIEFSWAKINFMGFFASFNKGISGGGYGPIITSGQILSGLDSKSSVSISSFTEAMTCLMALLIYLLKLKIIDFMPVLPLLVGSFLAIPFAVRVVKKSNGKKHVIAIGIITISLGLATLIKVIQGVF
jgi:uncharacterized membrane protein YfcA